jgi:hypothetical protein
MPASIAYEACKLSSKLTLSQPLTPNGVFKQCDRVKGVSKFTNKVNTYEEQLISDV